MYFLECKFLHAIMILNAEVHIFQQFLAKQADYEVTWED